MPRRTQTYAIRLAVEGGGQVKAELVSVGQSGDAIPSATTIAAIGNWNHATDRNWHGYIDFIYLWNRVLDLGARRAIQNNPYQLVKPRLSGRTYVAYGITAPGPPLGDSGEGSIVIAIAS